MSKKLPNIFKGIVPKNNNQNSSVINNENTVEKEVVIEEKNINRQINDIFTSDSFVYKADTIITLNTGEVLKKTIIGKTNSSLITIDDELIDVSSISKIELN